MIFAHVISGAAMTAAAIAGSIGVAPGSPPHATSAAPADLGCGSNPTADYNSPGDLTASGVRIRTGPSTTCTIKGDGYPGQAVTVHCLDEDWVYLTDNATGVTGWLYGGDNNSGIITWTVPVAGCAFPPSVSGSGQAPGVTVPGGT